MCNIIDAAGTPRPQLTQKRVIMFGVWAAAVAACFPAIGEGFRNPPPGTFNLGRAGGRIAHIDDSSAITQNPANLAELDRAEIQFTPSIVYMSVDFASSLGQSSKTEDPWKLLPNGYVALPMSNQRFALGLGITAPYGLSVNWDDASTTAFAPGTGVLRYTSPHYAELMTANFNPTVAFKVNDHLFIGIGADVMWSRLTLKQYYPWAIFPGSGGAEPDGTLKGQGDGLGFGGNFGITWKINDRHTVAFTYRSQMDVEYDGDTRIDNITPTAAGFGATGTSDFASTFNFPNILAVGYGIQITDTIRIESNVEWIEFSRFDTLSVDLGNNNILLPPANRNIPQNWRDTFTFGIGGDWQFAERWVLRAGYQFYESPVPGETFSPTIPDADQNVITVGLGYRGDNFSVEFAYGADFYDKRTIVNPSSPAFNGTYDVTVHLFSVAYRLAF